MFELKRKLIFLIMICIFSTSSSLSIISDHYYHKYYTRYNYRYRYDRMKYFASQIDYHISSLFLSSNLNNNRQSNNNNNNDNNNILEWKTKAEQLRREVQEYEEKKKNLDDNKMNDKLQSLYNEQSIFEKYKEQYSVTVPILKPNGDVVDELCYFQPIFPLNSNDGTCTSRILVYEASLPLGLLLSESEDIVVNDDNNVENSQRTKNKNTCIVVDEVYDNSNGKIVGILPGDIIRACTACQITMDTSSTWQLLVGGIGQPKTIRFMYSADRQSSIEEIIDAISSNRFDKFNRPVILVIERKDVE